MTERRGYLGIDIGNTRVKVHHFERSSGDATSVLRSTMSLSDRTVANVLSHVRSLSRPPHERVHVVSVDPSIEAPLLSALRAFGDVVVSWGDERPIPVPHGYPAGKRPGDDRLLAALAAHRRGFGRAIVVDLGTAVKVDVVDQDGRFLGGAIAPGLDVIAETLGRRGKKLFHVDPRRIAQYPACDTESALLLGIDAAWSGAVDRLVRSARALYGDARIVLTGGDAERAAELLADLAPTIDLSLLADGFVALDEAFEKDGAGA